MPASDCLKLVALEAYCSQTSLEIVIEIARNTMVRVAWTILQERSTFFVKFMIVLVTFDLEEGSNQSKFLPLEYAGNYCHFGIVHT